MERKDSGYNLIGGGMGSANAPKLERNHSARRQKSSVVHPSATENISNVAKVLHRHIYAKDSSRLHDHKAECRERFRFNINNFIQNEFNPRLSHCSHSPFSGYSQVAKKVKLPEPTVKVIYTFMKRFFERALLNPECSIIALIYIERLMEQYEIKLSEKNWIPIVLCALLLSSKVWDDLSSWNIEFSEIFPAMSVKMVNKLEREFLDAISYNLYISGSSYAKYYFALRALRQTSSAPRNIPKYYLKLNIGPSRNVKWSNKEEVDSGGNSFPTISNPISI